MNQQTTNPSSASYDAQLATVAAKLVAIVAVWWVGVTLLDFVPLSDPIWLRTAHIGMWIFLIELLLGCLKTTADQKQKPESGKMADTKAGSMSPLADFWVTSQSVAAGFLWRVPALALGTCLVIVWCGYGPSAQLGAFLPTLICAVARRRLVKAAPLIEPSSFIRGTLLRTQAYAEGRAPEINALGPIELANRLGELNDFTAGNQTSA